VEILARANALDLIILALLAAGLLAGWQQGLIRQLLGMAAFYVALVLGAQYHWLVGGWVMSISPNASWVAVDSLAFLFLFIVVLITFNWVGRQVYADTHIPFFSLLDGLAGALFGMVAACLQVIIALSLLRFVQSVPWFEWESTRQVVLQVFRASALEPIFTGAAPLLYVLIRPWLPSGLPALFSL
jgi:membrane protein required for colicin V production